MKRQCLALVALASLLVASVALAQERSITVASTTSTEQSGLFGYLLPQFTAKSGIRVNVVAVGTGQALDIGRRGDADVVFVHDKAAEEKFLAEGFGVKRFDVMYNDFVVIGPGSDPARIAGGEDVLEALRKIAAIKAPFISRGDRSGTHAAELRYWHDAGIDIGAVKGAWYRGTWLSFQNRGELSILVAGDRRLFNQYGVMLVNPAKHPNVRTREGQAFVDWLVSPEGQRTIAAYKVGGEQLFFPDAGDLKGS